MFRFYFVGDEDLLEIIGNSKNVGRLQKHFKKMFAGVATITLNDDNSQVLGLLSKEGEEVSRHMKGPFLVSPAKHCRYIGVMSLSTSMWEVAVLSHFWFPINRV